MNLPFVLSQKMRLRRNRWLLKGFRVTTASLFIFVAVHIVRNIVFKIYSYFRNIVTANPVINKKNGIVCTKCQTLLYPNVIYKYWLALHHIVRHCGFLFTINKKNIWTKYYIIVIGIKEFYNNVRNKARDICSY